MTRCDCTKGKGERKYKHRYTSLVRFQPLTPELKLIVQDLRKQQEELRKKIRLQPLSQPLHYIAGCDSALIEDDIFSVFVIFSFPDLREIEVQFHRSPLTLPYISGFLAFREIPNLVKTYEKMRHKPDLIMVDGQGIMHPKRMGIATQLGITLSVPTIGVAKKKLFGTYIVPEETKGAFSYVYDKEEKLGIALRSKDKVNPIFISPGHLCDLETAHTIVTTTLTKYKLPEPTRIADKYSKELKTKIK